MSATLRARVYGVGYLGARESSKKRDAESELGALELSSVRGPVRAPQRELFV